MAASLLRVVAFGEMADGPPDLPLSARRLHSEAVPCRGLDFPTSSRVVRMPIDTSRSSRAHEGFSQMPAGGHPLIWMRPESAVTAPTWGVTNYQGDSNLRKVSVFLRSTVTGILGSWSGGMMAARSY